MAALKNQKMATFKQLSEEEDRLIGGHTLCAGCPESTILRAVLHATRKPVVVVCATSCLEVSTTKYPFTSWKVSFMHNAFENAAATISGIERAHKALLKKGKIKEDIKFLAVAGDGGTYDIGLQSLSGALERQHDFLFVCYDNEGYMNTGNQRSSATPLGAWTKTTPVGKLMQGKQTDRKDIMSIVTAHKIPYAAQASPSHYLDLVRKAKKGFDVKGPAFINVLSPCVIGWKYPSSKSIRIASLAVETRFWPLYEIENGKFRLNYAPKKRVPIVEFIKAQGRYKHLLHPKNKPVLRQIQKNIDEEWARLLKLCRA